MKTAIALIFAASINAAPVPQTVLDKALADAVIEWGYPEVTPMGIKSDYLNACDIERKPYPRIAQILMDSQETMSTFRPDVEDPDIDTEATVIPPPQSTVVLHFVLVLNSACDWSRLDIKKTAMHELGHFYIGMDYHSADPASIMYRTVKHSQTITESDRSEMEKKYVGYLMKRLVEMAGNVKK